ncbi:MAG: glycosyltransferase family 39 protein [Elusimicrobia bacterium]|nr:glycosyltransferase family 39 protein [Elusimicrobiota bacterium]
MKYKMSKFKNFITNHFNITAFLIFAVVVFSLYGKTLFFDWTYYDDDVLILDKQEYLSFSNIKNILFTTVFGQDGDKFCRPVLNLTFLFEKYFYGIKPLGYHFTNILIHLFAVFSIFLFLTLRYDKKKTLILCLFFLCHPALTQAVAWVPGRNDSLLTIFLVLSCYFFVKYVDKNKKTSLILYCVFFILALFTKETAIVVPVFYFMILICNKKGIKQYLLHFVIITLIILIYLLYRNIVLNYQTYSLTFKILIINFYSSFPTITKYIANIFFPVKLSIFPTMLEVNYLLCITSVLVFVLLFIKSRSYNLKIISFGFIWFFLFLFPTFLMPNNQSFDHRLYLPLVGIMIVVLEFINKNDKLFKIKNIIICSIIFLLFFTITFLYEQNFKNKEIFWVKAYTISPNSDIANAMVGGLLLERGLYNESEEKYKKAIELRESSKHYNNLAALYYRTKRIDDAEQCLLKSLSLNNKNPNVYYNLSLIYKLKGENEKAQEMKDWYIKVFNDTNKVSKIEDIDL